MLKNAVSAIFEIVLKSGTDQTAFFNIEYIFELLNQILKKFNFLESVNVRPEFSDFYLFIELHPILPPINNVMFFIEEHKQNCLKPNYNSLKINKFAIPNSTAKQTMRNCVCSLLQIILKLFCSSSYYSLKFAI
jgi:hypothetical protein